MNKLVIVLVDKDESYLMPIELKLIQEINDKLELIVISSEEYFEQYFALPRRIDILLINEDLYNSDLQRHNIGSTFILTDENLSKDFTDSLSIHKINKYTSVKEIYNVIMANNYTILEPTKENKQAKVIMVYSPSGGSGKTTVSIGLAAALKYSNRRVFYLNTENIQSFDFMLDNKQYCNSGFEKYLVNKEDRILDYLDKAMGKVPFDYLLPFKQAISSLNIGMEELKFFIEKLKESCKYDYIIVDTSNDFNCDKSMLMGYCDKVVVLTEQNKIDTIKLNSLKTSIDCSNANKFIFICNKYKSNEKNYLIKDDYINNCNIMEYIDYFEEQELKVEILSKDKSFIKLIYALN